MKMGRAVIARLLITCLALVALGLALARPAQSGNLVPDADCAVIVASRANLQEVQEFVDQTLTGQDFEVYLSSNGWYAISIGLIERSDAAKFLASQKKSGGIPQDSFCSTGNKFLRLVTLPPVQSLQDQSLLFAEFDARLLTETEKRILQLALASEGYYRALYDGKWGRGSQRALEQWVAATNPTLDDPKVLFADIFLLAVLVLEHLEDTGWQDMRFGRTAYNISAPWNKLTLKSERPLLYRMEDEGLFLIYDVSNESSMQELHQSTLDDMSFGDDPYLLRRDTIWVTKLRDKNGAAIYMRSDKVLGVWHNVAVTADPRSEHWLDLIASGIWVGEPRDWTIPEGGVLDQVIGDAIALALAEEAGESESGRPSQNKTDRVLAPEPDPIPITAQQQTSGTGFFVNNTDIVTAEHVVADCRSITTSDHVPLTLIAADNDLDLAALTSQQRSKNWLAVSEAAAPRLGQKIFAMGYPYYGLVGTSLHLTAGNVSSLTGPGDDHRFLTVSAPIQPGNSGGPVLSADGEILGVVSARLSQSFVSEQTGSLPQNVNYATSLGELRRFLEEASIFYPRGEPQSFDMDEGVPQDMQDAVVPVFCWR